MLAIMMEGALFIAGVAVVAALLVFGLIQFTPIGVRVRQVQNRRRLERAAELHCPIHGARAEMDLVRLTNGERVCPECFKETFHGNLD